MIGASGFVGSAIQSELIARDWETVAIARHDVELTATDATDRLMSLIHDGDTVVFAAADAPCKSYGQLEVNVKMFGPLIEVLVHRNVRKAVYVSSDAVYADSRAPLTELSTVLPTSIHGAMHVLRELVLRAQKRPWLILRPTLIYGADDPHDGYGPNKFIRDALAGRDISLFGGGEEQRDHIHISDVAHYSSLAIEHVEGIVNLATGRLSTFREVAEQAVRITKSRSNVVSIPRVGPMPHDGYRAFDIESLRQRLAARAPLSVIEGMERDVRRYG